MYGNDSPRIEKRVEEERFKSLFIETQRFHSLYSDSLYSDITTILPFAMTPVVGRSNLKDHDRPGQRSVSTILSTPYAPQH